MGSQSHAQQDIMSGIKNHRALFPRKSRCNFGDLFLPAIMGRGRENLKSSFLLKTLIMPITDATKKQIAQQRRLFFRICFKCGAKNHISAERCRKCHNNSLRLKNRTMGAKK
ncbi:MAG: 50S ribosomal protein L40e [Nitrososphaeraceae archaeon]